MTAGKFKRQKNIAKEIGDALEKVGNWSENTWVQDFATDVAGKVGKTIGSVTIPIPLFGGEIGKTAGEMIANTPFYMLGTVGEIGKVMQGKSNIGNVITYGPKRYIEGKIEEVKNNPIVQTIQGKKTLPDAIVDYAMQSQSLLEPVTKIHDAIFGKPDHSRTRLWVNKDGDASTTWKPGYNRIMYGDVVKKPAPIYNGSESILGTYQGQVYRKGVDDAAWRQLQKAGKVK